MSSNNESWRKFVDENGPRFRRVAARRLPAPPHGMEDTTSPDDVVQEVYLSVLDKGEVDLSRGKSAIHYIEQRVEWRAKDRLRGKMLHNSRNVSLYKDEGDDSQEIPDTSGQDRDPRLASIRQAVEQLPKMQREVIELHVYEGLKFKDISKELGRPVNTVKAQNRRGLEQIKRRLSGHS